MTSSLRTRMLLAAIAWAPMAASAAPVQPKQKFTLAQYVPDDCWMVIQGAHNPERAFIDAHWARVFEALKGTGIGNDIKTLIFSGAPVEQRAQVEEGFATAMKLLEGVRWCDLVGREMVFAERLRNFLPEIIVLCRSVPDSVEGNVAGLQAIFKQISQLGEGLTVTESEVAGAKVWRLASPEMPFAFFLIHKEDVVGLVLGEKAMHDITGLLAGKGSASSFAEHARFKKAVAELPPAEDEIGYFDLKMLMSDLNGIFETAFKKSHTPTSAPAGGKSVSEEDRAKRVIAKIVDHCNFLDYIVFTSHTDGLQEFTSADVRLQPQCKEKSLCKMFTGQKPFERFDKYVPKSATGFTLWDGLDVKELYTAVLDFIKEEAPGGPDILAKWAETQQDMGFDVEADFFSWWGGELISVTLPPAIKTPFSSADWVLMVRVKDARLAASKVNGCIDRLDALLKEHNQALIIRDVTDVQAEGFRSITHPMFAAMMGKVLVGVADDHLVLASSSEAINQCLDTAAGKAPSIVKNERFKAEGITPKGPVCGATFTDLSNMGQELAAAFFSMGFASAFIPDEEETKPIKAVFGMLSKLSPAINEINFYSSSASITEFDGGGWKTRQILTYKDIPAKAASQEVAEKP